MSPELTAHAYRTWGKLKRAIELGASKAGKTYLLNQILAEKLPKGFTVAVGVGALQMRIGNLSVAMQVLDTPGDDWYQIRAAWSPDDQFIVGSSWDWYSTVLGVFDAATGELLDKFSINMDESGVNHQTRVDFVGFTGDCGNACQDLVASSTLQEGDKKDETYMFANDLNYYDVLTLDADDARCQPTPAPVPAPHHSDGATALAAGLAVPALAALAL